MHNVCGVLQVPELETGDHSRLVDQACRSDELLKSGVGGDRGTAPEVFVQRGARHEHGAEETVCANTRHHFTRTLEIKQTRCGCMGGILRLLESPFVQNFRSHLYVE